MAVGDPIEVVDHFGIRFARYKHCITLLGMTINYDRKVRSKDMNELILLVKRARDLCRKTFARGYMDFLVDNNGSQRSTV